MNGRTKFWHALSWMAVGLSITVVSTAMASDEGWAAAEQVSPTEYAQHLVGLHTQIGHDRTVRLAETDDHGDAREYIYDTLESYGLSVEYEWFIHELRQGWNVVATKPGIIYPTSEYIIGAHYDSYSEPWLDPAPGADDNGSGVALMLEAARILSQYDSDWTIRFIAFDYEEHSPSSGGPVGSYAYLDAHQSDNITGMIAADMVAYDPNDTNHARIFGRKASTEIKNALAAAVAEYGCGLTCTVLGRYDASDHMSFEEHGFQACMLHEGEPVNPNYHTPEDAYDPADDYINIDYAVKMTRSVVGYLVDAAGVDVPVDTLEFTYPNGHPTFTDPHGSTHIVVEVTGVGNAVPQPGTGWAYFVIGNQGMFGPMREISPNVYEADFPNADCGELISYSFSAQDTGGTHYYDPECRSYSAIAGYGRRIIYENSFYADPSWPGDPLWAWGQPTGQGGDPAAGHTGSYVYGYNLNGEYENDLGERQLTTHAIDCTGMYGVHLSFWRWLRVEAPGFDHALVDVSGDGGTWETVWMNMGEVIDTEWQEVNLDISHLADNQPLVYVRWTMGSTDESVTYAGWNIDDVEIWASVFPPPGDVDRDGDVDLHDLASLLSSYNKCPGDPGYDAWANLDDLDGTGCVSLVDLAVLLAHYGESCP